MIAVGFCAIMTGLILMNPIIQGLFFYLNLPYHLIVDHSQPEQTQSFIYAGVEATVNYKITSSDGVQLGLWHMKSKMRRKIVLYLHGNGETRAHPWSVRKYHMLRTAPFEADVIAFDYRGFADSTGWPTENGLYQDARSVFQWILETFQLQPAEIVLYGHSLGSAVATELAAELCATKRCPAAVILEGPFTNIIDTVSAFIPPVALLESSVHHKFDSFSRIQKIECPVLIAQGSSDWIISPSLGKRLFQHHQAAHGSKATLISVPDAGHENLVMFNAFREQFQSWWQSIFNQSHFTIN